MVKKNVQVQKPTRLSVGRDERIRIAGVGTLAFPPNVTLESRAEWFGLGDAESIYYDPVLHRFDISIHAELVESRYGEDSGDRWRLIKNALALTHAPDLATDERIVISRLEIGEIPAHIVSAAGGWSDVLDALGDSLRGAIELVEGLRSDDNTDTHGLSLMDGALLWPRKLGVHPLFRGRRLGLRLLAHALWALHRSDSDVAVLEAAAIQTWFDEVKPEQTRASFEALCRHYARLGFRRWDESLKPHRLGGSLMYSTFGQNGLPMKGLGLLSNFP